MQCSSFEELVKICPLTAEQGCEKQLVHKVWLSINSTFSTSYLEKCLSAYLQALPWQRAKMVSKTRSTKISFTSFNCYWIAWMRPIRGILFLVILFLSSLIGMKNRAECNAICNAIHFQRTPPQVGGETLLWLILPLDFPFTTWSIERKMLPLKFDHSYNVVDGFMTKAGLFNKGYHIIADNFCIFVHNFFTSPTSTQEAPWTKTLWSHDACGFFICTSI